MIAVGVVVVFAVALMFVAGYFSQDYENGFLLSDVEADAFAEYTDLSVELTPAVADYTVESDFSNVENIVMVISPVLLALTRFYILIICFSIMPCVRWNQISSITCQSIE